MSSSYSLASSSSRPSASTTRLNGKGLVLAT
jgi:hypothetical protein